MGLYTRFKIYCINRKIKKLNNRISRSREVKDWLVVENERLDLINKINKIKGKKNDK